MYLWYLSQRNELPLKLVASSPQVLRQHCILLIFCINIHLWSLCAKFVCISYLTCCRPRLFISPKFKHSNTMSAFDISVNIMSCHSNWWLLLRKFCDNFVLSLFFILTLICEVYVQNLCTFLISRAAGLVYFFLPNLNTLTLCVSLIFEST